MVANMVTDILFLIVIVATASIAMTTQPFNHLEELRGSDNETVVMVKPTFDNEQVTFINDEAYVDFLSGETEGGYSTMPPVDLSKKDQSHVVWLWNFTWTWTTIALVVFSFLGVIGNGLVLLALARHRASRNHPDIFIGALALADFLTSVFIFPVPRAVHLPDSALGAVYCILVFTRYPMWVCIHASIYILTGMSVERFIAIVYPLSLHRRLTRRHVVIYLLVVWVMSLPSCLHFLTVNVVNNACRNVKTPVEKKITAFYLFAYRVGIPALTMIITQGITAISLHHQSRGMRGSSFVRGGDAPSFHVIARNRVVTMTFLIVLIYIVTVGPNELATLITVMTGTHSVYHFSTLYYTFTYMTFINSCANPFIYAARYPKFRTAILDMLTFKVVGKNTSPFDQAMSVRTRPPKEASRESSTSHISHSHENIKHV